MKRKRIIKVNARKVQESDIALGERIQTRRNQKRNEPRLSEKGTNRVGALPSPKN